MTTTTDFTAMFKDMMGNFPMDTKAVEDAFKSQTALAEKMSAVALEAAQKSTDLSAKWAKETLVKMADLSKAKEAPADYAKSLTDFASTSAEAAAEHMSAFAEIAKKVQTETLELMMAAGKAATDDMTAVAAKASADLTAAAKKATGDVTAAAKKATAAAK